MNMPPLLLKMENGLSACIQSVSTFRKIIVVVSTILVPSICREYTTEHCEYEDEWVYDQYFETPEQVVEYMEAVLGPGGEEVGDGKKKKHRQRSIRSPKPALLKIL